MKLRTMMMLLVLAGVVATPLLATAQTDNAQKLLQAARLWDGKERTDIARDLLQKLLLIKPDAAEALSLLAEIELRSGKPELALRYQRQLEKADPTNPLLPAMRDRYRVATRDKGMLARMRLIARAGQAAEAEKLLLQLFPGQPPQGELALEYYSILASSPKGAAKARAALSALYQESGDLRYRLGLLDLMANNSDSRPAALKGYEELSKDAGVNSRRLQESWRRSLYKLRDDPATIAQIKRYLVVFPDDKSMREQIGTVQKNHLEQTRLAQAGIGRRSVTETERKSRDPLIAARGAALDTLEQGDLAAAEKKLNDLFKLRPNDPEITGALGLIRLKRGEHAEAERRFVQANLATRGGSKKWSGLVTTARFWHSMRSADNLLEQHELAEAEKLVNAALELQANDPDALALLGNIRLAAQDNDAAEKLFREALARDGENGSAMRGLVSVLTRSARRDAALSLLMDYARRHPQDQSRYAAAQAGLLRDEAETFIAAARPSHALQALEMAVVLAPADPWHRFALAKLYDSLGLAPLAKQVMLEGVVQAPQDASMRYARALILNSQNDYEAALRELAAIPQAEKTQSMRAAELRANLSLRIDRAQAELALGKQKDAVRSMIAAETLAAEQADLPSAQQLAEGWFGLNLPERGLDLARRDLTPASPVADQVHFAALLNRAKKDQELAALLPALGSAILAQAPELQVRHELTLREIRQALHQRELERLLDAGALQQARKAIDGLLLTQPDSPDLLLLAGRVAKAERDYSGAMRYFKQSESLAAQVTDSGHSEPEKFSDTRLLLDLLPVDEDQPQLAAAGLRNIQLKLSDALGASDAKSERPQPPAASNSALNSARKEIASIEARRQPRLELGMDSTYKSAGDGTSSYRGRELPAVGWLPIDYDGHAFVHLDRVELNAGNLPADFSESSQFGQIQAAHYQLAQVLPQKAAGTSVGVGYESDGLRADIGVVGLGFPRSNLVGGLRQSGTLGRLDYSLDLSRRVQTSSLLSYAGATDPVSGQTWGGVTNTGLAGKLSTTLSDVSVSTSLSYGVLRGKNVLNNDKLSLRVALDKDIYRSPDLVLNAGIAFNYLRFAENESFYSFGHGGYYSPQRSVGLSLPLEINGRANRFSYLLRASVSYTQTEEKSMALYPNDPALQAIANAASSVAATYAGSSGGGIGYALRAAAEYRVTPQLSIGARLDIDRSAYYAPNSGLLYLRYSFKPELGEINLSPKVVKPYSQF